MCGLPPAILDQKDNVVALQKNGDKIVAEQRSSLQSALNEFSGVDYTFIKCGGEDLTSQFREQWTDGANMFALAPGVAVGYERNTRTFNTLVDHGYAFMNQFEFVEEYGNAPLPLNDELKIAISFQGHELCARSWWCTLYDYAYFKRIDKPLIDWKTNKARYRFKLKTSESLKN